MDDSSFEITLKCLFCDIELQGAQDAQYVSSDMIKCQACGESNDYDSLISVAIEVGKQKVTQQIHDQLKQSLKKAFK